MRIGGEVQALVLAGAAREGLRRLRDVGPAAEVSDLIVDCYMGDNFKMGMETFLAKKTRFGRESSQGASLLASDGRLDHKIQSELRRISQCLRFITGHRAPVRPRPALSWPERLGLARSRKKSRPGRANDPHYLRPNRNEVVPTLVDDDIVAV